MHSAKAREGIWGHTQHRVRARGFIFPSPPFPKPQWEFRAHLPPLLLKPSTTPSCTSPTLKNPQQQRRWEIWGWDFPGCAGGLSRVLLSPPKDTPGLCPVRNSPALPGTQKGSSCSGATPHSTSSSVPECQEPFFFPLSFTSSCRFMALANRHQFSRA